MRFGVLPECAAILHGLVVDCVLLLCFVLLLFIGGGGVLRVAVLLQSSCVVVCLHSCGSCGR